MLPPRGQRRDCRQAFSHSATPCNGSIDVLVYFSPSQASSPQPLPWGTIHALLLSVEELHGERALESPHPRLAPLGRDPWRGDQLFVAE